MQHGGKVYKYDAFGNELASNANDANPFRYAGEYFDKETECYYLRARYYEPSTGRFLTEDPIRDGLNFYTYCYGNPILFVDPSGLDADQFGMFIYDGSPFPTENSGPVQSQLNWMEEIQFMIDDVNFRLKMIEADPIGANVIFIFEQIGSRLDSAVGNIVISLAEPIEPAMTRSEFEKAHEGQYNSIEMERWWNLYAGWYGASAQSMGSPTGNVLTTNKNQLKHMFRDDSGHFLLDTPENRAVIISAASNTKNFMGVDKWGNSWYAEILPNGTQAWAEVRNSIITEGGLNSFPKIFDPLTGLKVNNTP